MPLVRSLHPDFAAAIAEPFFYPVILVFLDWPGAPIRAHSGLGTLTWGGQTWAGLGPFGRITLPEEKSGMASFPAEITLTGLPDDLDDWQADTVRGIDIRVYFGAVTERAGTVLRGDPDLAFAGTADAKGERIDADPGDAAIRLNRTAFVSLTSGPSQRARGSAYNSPEDRVAADPTDTAGEHLPFAEAYATPVKFRWL